MSALFPLDAVLLFALEVVAKATLLLVAGAAAYGVARRRGSAATRHLLWTVAILGLLSLPLLAAAPPLWRVPAPPAPVSFPALTAPQTALPAPAATVAAPETPAPAAPPLSGLGLLGAIYALGAGLLLARLAAERWALGRVTGGAEEVRDEEWTRLLRECARALGVERPVRLLRSRVPLIPLTCGTRRPSIVLPAGADGWPEERRRAVILHEMAHVARRDCLVQSLAALASALYWFHPGVWWAASRLRAERELACDDRVIRAGIAPRAYAWHLLEIARTLPAPRGGALALSMARPTQLEGRMLAALDPRRVRSVPGTATRLLVGWGAALLLAGLAITGIAQGRAARAAAAPPPAPSTPEASALAVAPSEAPETPLPAAESGETVVAPWAAATAAIVESLPEPSAGIAAAEPPRAALRLSPIAPSPVAIVTTPRASTPARSAPLPRPRAELLTREEIVGFQGTDVHSLVRAARPQWLRIRASSFAGNQTEPQLYLDGQRLGGVEAMRSLSTAGVLSIRYYSPSEAASRWGMDHDQGAIYVSTADR